MSKKTKKSERDLEREEEEMGAELAEMLDPKTKKKRK